MLNLQRFTSQRKDPPASTSKAQRTSYFIPSDSDD
uniref:Uncharacterized protein n=1 Tax=Bracon brevicornis TaxID=1563983 RepID=A0A6V7L4Z2_9HYME